MGVKTPEPGWWVRRVPRGTGPRGPTRAGLVAPRGPGSGPHLWARQQVLGVLLRHTTPGSLGMHTPPGPAGEQGLPGPTLGALGTTGRSACSVLILVALCLRQVSGSTDSAPTRGQTGLSSGPSQGLLGKWRQWGRKALGFWAGRRQRLLSWPVRGLGIFISRHPGCGPPPHSYSLF